MNAAGLIARGQAFAQKQLPATITIAGQVYDCAQSGKHRERDLVNGGWLPGYRISFFILASAFVVAGKAQPTTEQFVQHDGTDYVIREIPSEPTAQTLTLVCRTPDAA